jgi:pimeloyl-ACP methyl ester carboxylesterase
MKHAQVNGVEIEYEAVGSGDPVLLISPVLADGFAPLAAESSLAARYELIRYHKRGWVGSTHTLTPPGVVDHAADAAALLDHLGIARAHVVGHSSGAAVAAQLALNEPERVATLGLLELSLLSLPRGEAFLSGATPVFEAYAAGDHEAAVGMFLSTVSGLHWDACRALLEDRVPGAIAQAVKDADTFFGVELPGLTQWTFGAEEAAAIHQPVLSVLGSDTEALWVEVAEALLNWMSDIEEQVIDGVGHLLHVQRPEPVANAMADFLGRHPIRAGAPLIDGSRTPDNSRSGS